MDLSNQLFEKEIEHPYLHIYCTIILMALRITVLPASTQAGRETIRALLTDGKKPFVNAVYRDLSKAPAEFVNNPQFKAVKGDVSEDSNLDFSRSDALFYIPPPTYDGTDSTEFATRNASNIKAALKRAQSVKRLLVFSAIGAQHDKGIVSSFLTTYPERLCTDLVRAFW